MALHESTSLGDRGGSSAPTPLDAAAPNGDNAPQSFFDKASMDDVAEQTIRFWSVVSTDRLAGEIYNRPGQPDGQKMMTTPVVEVRFMGALPTPVAFTRSGSTYWLGEPAPDFGLDAAEDFVYRMSQTALEEDADHDPSRPVTIPLVPDAPRAVRPAAGEESTRSLLLDDLERWIKRL